MMGLFNTAMNLVHGKSKTETPFTNFHELTAPDIDLNQVKFADLAGQVRCTLHQRCCMSNQKLHLCLSATGRSCRECGLEMRQDRS